MASPWSESHRLVTKGREHSGLGPVVNGQAGKVPAAKSIPARLRKMIAAAVAGDVPRQPCRPQRSEQPQPD
ncbi:hypothetical protein [Stutzerimonas frequens]|uniref:Uncharacterized protein n=1 Tax=Stutzerimonas frequens TaxID=2968969 RepID=A0AA47E307_9GAMM|nr:hypothetical protein [Stutzerimonas frequens]WAE53003.1 hypothetical protein OSV15_02065 [Stutzerimonas frequens]